MGVHRVNNTQAHYDDNFYRHLGVYGICVREERILVIEKILGPYTGQFDLPGGRIETHESLERAITREFKEETGFTIQKLTNIGVSDFFVMWTRRDNTDEHLHHIAIMYEVELNAQQPTGSIDTFDGQDSSRAVWLPITEVTPQNSSPLVLQAVHWIKFRTMPVGCKCFDYRKRL
jgi:ADP-ribose pyrophosphatase YjhB (NUDIX family)